MCGNFRNPGIYLVVLLVLIACKEEDPVVINKLDPALKQQVEQMEGTMMSVILRTEAELSNGQESKLVSLGVVIQSRTRTVYVCRIPSKSILPVARESFILGLEAPKELKPL
ncbi:uncharacterized protein METZ01_LOCUS203725 [marine metagenome]|uniref:Uncharacterized protein n=1 Tax=marine metagenome TaxID=408172 RepID=A0A382ELN0_9ZZZZ